MARTALIWKCPGGQGWWGWTSGERQKGVKVDLGRRCLSSLCRERGLALQGWYMGQLGAGAREHGGVLGDCGIFGRSALPAGCLFVR